MDKKFKPLALFCMVLLVAVGFLGLFSSIVVVDAPEPTPTVAIAEYDYYVVAGHNMTPTPPPPDSQPTGFTFNCVANNNATSSRYNFGSLEYHGGRDYLYDGCAETSSPYNDNAYVTVNITNNLGYTITIEDLTAEITAGTPTRAQWFEWSVWMGNVTVVAVDTLDPWDPTAEDPPWDEVNYNTGLVEVHRDAVKTVYGWGRDDILETFRGYPDWFRKATGIQGHPYLATQLGPSTLLKNDLSSDALSTGHVAPKYGGNPITLANGETFTEYFGINILGDVDVGTQINATITLSLTYTPPPESELAVCGVDIANAVTIFPGYRLFETTEVFNEWNLPINITVLNVGTLPLTGSVSGYYSLDNATWLSMGSSQPISLNPINGTLLVFYWNLRATGAGKSVYFMKFNVTATSENLTSTDEFLVKIKVRLMGDSDGDNDCDVGDQRKLALTMFSHSPEPHYFSHNIYPIFTDKDGDLDVDVGDSRKQQINMFKMWNDP